MVRHRHIAFFDHREMVGLLLIHGWSSAALVSPSLAINVASRWQAARNGHAPNPAEEDNSYDDFLAGELEHGAFLRRYVNTLVAIVFNLRQVVGGLMGDAGTIVAPPVHERFVGRNAHDYALLLRMQATCQEWGALLLKSQGHC